MSWTRDYREGHRGNLCFVEVEHTEGADDAEEDLGYVDGSKVD